MRQAVRLVGEPIRWAEALGGAYGAGPLAGVNIWVQGTISLKAILFGSGWRKKGRHILSLFVFIVLFSSGGRGSFSSHFTTSPPIRAAVKT